MKNPIAVIFGNVLRDTRNSRKIQIVELTEKIGINNSYYRLLESGTHVLHISKTIDLTNAFNHFGVKFSYEGVSKLILGIYFTQPLIASSKDESSLTSLSDLLDNLREYDKKLYLIILAFNKYGMFEDESNDKKFNGISQLKNLVSQFITNYDDFGETFLKLQNDFIESFFKDFPSIYVNVMYDLRKNLMSLPTNLGVSHLWEWEEFNQDKFVELYAYTHNSKSVSSSDNLNRYTYKYLWNDQFKKAIIYYSDKRSEEDFLNSFRDNLLKSIRNQPEYTKNFEKAIKKLTVRYVPKFDLPQGKLFLEKRGIDYNPNTCWTFSLNNKINVGFLAEVNPENNLLSNGESLNIKASNELLEYFQKLESLYEI